MMDNKKLSEMLFNLAREAMAKFMPPEGLPVDQAAYWQISTSPEEYRQAQTKYEIYSTLGRVFGEMK